MSYLSDIQSTLQRLKPLLASKYHVCSIGLFGSIVRDDFSMATSDIDIIVDFSQPIGIEFVDMADLLEKELKRQVDVVSRKGLRISTFSRLSRR